MGGADPVVVISSIIVLFFAIGIHEYAHCKVADLAGDPTPRFYGRVTLNLTKHFEPLGTIMMVVSSMSGFGIGWGRPAPINPSKMRNPRWDTFFSVAAGPLSNVLQSVVYAIVFRLWMHLSPSALVESLTPIGDRVSINFTPLGEFLWLGVVINITLALFNLIPFGPLDGHWLVGQLLPEKQRLYWYKFNRSIGIFGLLILMTILNVIASNGGPDVIGTLLQEPTYRAVRTLTGLG